tara:strand:+ start:1724 stop:2197 length:474 start_codon:yes stop_codon:yes gene_type:complete
MIKRDWVETVILAIIVCNIFVLAYIFIIPRAQFIFDHWEWEYEDLMETSGPMDMPNQYPRTYKVTNEIRNVTQENSIILMPKDNWEFGSNKSVVIQRLYPRKVYFFGDDGFYDQKNNLEPKTTIYAVAFAGDKSNLCFKKNIRNLDGTGFVLCKWIK